MRGASAKQEYSIDILASMSRMPLACIAACPAYEAMSSQKLSSRFQLLLCVHLFGTDGDDGEEAQEVTRRSSWGSG